MNDRYVPINKGNYSMDTPEREALFHANLAGGWEAGYEAYRSNWVEYAKSQHVAPYPLLVDLELASVCNLRCPMCYTISAEFKERVDTRLMDFALFKRVIDEIGGKVPALRLSLRGEATLHKKFVECIAYAKSRGIKEVSTLTHGGKLSGAFMRRVVDAGIDWITISIDGVGETYERIRKPIKFSQILDNIKEIKRYKDERGLRKPVIKVQGVWPAIQGNPSLYYDTFAPYVDLVAFNPLIDYLGNDRAVRYLEEFTCPQQYQRLVVGADGLVMKCSNDEENREVIGDLNKQTVHEVWHGEAMNRVRALHKRRQGFKESEVCRRCYLPRQTKEEVARVGNRLIVVHNYTNRIQIIGQ
jgi:radical SAM protein with 4Fe4S-binding SPASM domain